MSPDLCDEYHWTAAFSKEEVMEAMASWFDLDEVHGPVAGSKIIIEVVEMTEAEIEELPEI